MYNLLNKYLVTVPASTYGGVKSAVSLFDHLKISSAIASCLYDKTCYDQEMFYMLEIDVPGYDKEDIKIELQDGYLTVSAEKNEEKEDKHAKYLKRERFTGMCSRSYYVGDNLKEEDIKANFKNGILTIEFPKEVEKKVEEKKYIPIGE